MTHLNIFFDLEETLIKEWENPSVLHDNISIIKNKIQLLKEKFDLPIRFHIFSFAIVNQRDLDRFNEHERDWIENTFGKLETIFIANDNNLFELIKAKGLTPMIDDKPSDLMGNMKSEGFEQLVLRDHQRDVNILFDDLVLDTQKELFHGDMFSSQSNSTIIIEIKV